MPQQYRTYDEIEAELTRPRSYGTTGEGGTTSPESAAQVTAAPGTALAATQGAEIATPSATMNAGAEAPGRVQDLSIQNYSGPDVAEEYQSLFAPITKQRQEATSNLRNLSTTFQEEAGPSRTWESIKGGEQISAALQPDLDQTKDQQEMDAASSLLHAAYTGPTGLETQGTDELQGTISGLQDTRRALEGPSGLQALLQYRSTTPATPDELEMEAGRLLADRDYLESARAASGGIENLAAQLSAAQRGAQAYGEQRTAEEEGIARGAETQLRGVRSGIDASLANRIKIKSDRDKAIEDAFGSYIETGNLADLEAYAPGIQETFNTEAVHGLEVGKAILAQIRQKYQEIADVPLLSPQITSHGRSRLGWSKEDLDALKIKYPNKKDLERIRTLATQRQEEIATSGFDPSVVTQHDVSGGQYRIGSKEEDLAGAGKYSTLLPMAYGGDLGNFKPINPNPYITLEQGTGATRENVARPEQREKYNRASDLLDLATRLEEPETDYQKSKIAIQGDKYLADEEAQLQARRDTLTENEKAYMGEVHKQRSKYKKAVSLRQWTTVAQVMLWASGAGTPAEVPTQGIIDAPPFRDTFGNALQSVTGSSTW
jgi:hypothetical protein